MFQVTVAQVLSCIHRLAITRRRPAAYCSQQQAVAVEVRNRSVTLPCVALVPRAQVCQLWKKLLRLVVECR